MFVFHILRSFFTLCWLPFIKSSKLCSYSMLTRVWCEFTCDSPWRSLYLHASERVSPPPRDSSVPNVAGRQFLEFQFCEVIHLASVAQCSLREADTLKGSIDLGLGKRGRVLWSTLVLPLNWPRGRFSRVVAMSVCLSHRA